MTSPAMSAQTPVAWRVIAKGGKFTRGIYEAPSREDFEIWKSDGDAIQPLYLAAPEQVIEQCIRACEDEMSQYTGTDNATCAVRGAIRYCIRRIRALASPARQPEQQQEPCPTCIAWGAAVFKATGYHHVSTPSEVEAAVAAHVRYHVERAGTIAPAARQEQNAPTKEAK